MAQVLIIEDDDSMRSVLKDMLERQNYEVMVASDGEEGLKMFRDNPTSLVITDIIMPNKEGMELIFEFQQDFPDTKIIAISGGGKGSANDYLNIVSTIPNVKRVFEKPFAMDEMLQAVKEFVT